MVIVFHGSAPLKEVIHDHGVLYTEVTQATPSPSTMERRKLGFLYPFG